MGWYISNMFMSLAGKKNGVLKWRVAQYFFFFFFASIGLSEIYWRLIFLLAHELFYWRF